MKETLLPRIQLVLVALFAATALCGPMLFRQMETLIFIIIAFGAALGAVTFWIGWQAAVRKSGVQYPFADWSRTLLKPFLSPRQRKSLRQSRESPPALQRHMLGIVSLVGGGLLVAAMLVVAGIVLIP